MELNEKLLKFAGFTNSKALDSDRMPLWWYPAKGATVRENRLPNFLISLDACFKWLVPKLREVIKLEGIEFCSENDGEDLVCITFWPETGNKIADNYMDMRQGMAETPTLALCKAIEQLIDREELNGTE